MQLSIELFPDLRLKILKAAQANQKEQVLSLLQSNPELIHAKTTTKGSSLLHIAAQCGHEELCTLLLNADHETNPVDFEGKTPFQRANKQPIKNLLMLKHVSKLFKDTLFEYEAFLQIRNCIVHKEAPLLLTNAEFLEMPEIAGMSSDTFAITALIYSENNYQLITSFREEALMIPFYGELLVIHENEQVNHFLKVIQDNREDKISTSFMEITAYAMSISTLLARYPKLIGYPKPSDTPEVIHAKKLIIAYGLIGFAVYQQQLSAEEWAQLLTLKEVRTTAKLAEQILHIDHREVFNAFREELDEIYQMTPTPTLKKQI